MIIDFNRLNGGGGSGTALQAVSEFPQAAEGTVVAYTGASSASGVYQYTGEEWVPVGVDDLSAYWTSAQTQSAITIVEDHLFDVEQVTASALTELHDGLMEVSGRTVSTEEIELPIAAAVNDLKGNIEARLSQKYYTRQEVNNIAARKVEAGQVDVQIKDYVDPAIAEVNDTIEDKELPVSAAINDLNQKISGKADKANLSTGDTNLGDLWFPNWNEQGIITGKAGLRNFQIRFDINGIRNRVTSPDNGYIPSIWAPSSVGTAGDILVSTGNGAPVWSAMTFPTPDVDKAYVDSAITGVQDQLDVIDEVIPAAIVDLNTRKVESTSVHTIWRGTQAEYDAITTKDASTLYIIL